MEEAIIMEGASERKDTDYSSTFLHEYCKNNKIDIANVKEVYNKVYPIQESLYSSEWMVPEYAHLFNSYDHRLVWEAGNSERTIIYLTKVVLELEEFLAKLIKDKVLGDTIISSIPYGDERFRTGISNHVKVTYLNSAYRHLDIDFTVKAFTQIMIKEAGEGISKAEREITNPPRCFAPHDSQVLQVLNLVLDDSTTDDPSQAFGAILNSDVAQQAETVINSRESFDMAVLVVVLNLCYNMSRGLPLEHWQDSLSAFRKRVEKNIGRYGNDKR